MRKTTKKKIAPIVITAAVVLYMLPLVVLTAMSMAGVLQDGPAAVSLPLLYFPLGGAGVGMWFYFCRVRSNPLFFVPFLVCSTTFLVTLLSSGYLYGLLEREEPMKETVRFAVILGITKPLRAVLAALGCYGLLFLAMSIFPLSGLYLLLLGFSFPCFLGSFFLRTVLNTSGSGKEDGC